MFGPPYPVRNAPPWKAYALQLFLQITWVNEIFPESNKSINGQHILNINDIHIVLN